MERHEVIHKGRWAIFVNNFVGGIGWALGATVGISLIIAILSLVIKQINLIPIFGNFVSGVATYVIDNNSRLR